VCEQMDKTRDDHDSVLLSHLGPFPE